MNTYELGKYKYFDLLVKYNFEHLTDEEKTNLKIKKIGDNIRSDNDIELYNSMLKDLFDIIGLESFEDVIRRLLNLVGFILFRHPFKDGNSRTLKYFLKTFFIYLNYDLNIENYENPIIPIFYNENETCTDKDIQNILNRLKKLEK